MEAAALTTTTEPSIADVPPAAILRGTARGLEVIVTATAATADIAAAVLTRLDEAPGFFKGSNVRVRVENGPLASGCLARLDEIASQYDLTIVEVSAVAKPTKGSKAKRPQLVTEPADVDADAVPEPSQLAAGSAPAPATQAGPRPGEFEEEGPTSSKVLAAPAAHPGAAPVDAPAAAPTTLAESELAVASAEAFSDAAELIEEPTRTVAPRHLAATPEVSLKNEPGTRVVVGPVRSGVILEHVGNLVIFGDINPGAEVRASGNIVVLGRLRGTAHAGIGQDVGFILALRLEPQQLRIGRQVARAADSDVPASEPELAYATGGSIVVERYLGKLPRNLATSI